MAACEHETLSIPEGKFTQKKQQTGTDKESEEAMDISKYLLTHQLRHSAAVFVYHQLDSDLFGSAHFAFLGYPTPILTSHDSHLKVKGKTPPDLLIYNLCYTEKCKKNQLPLSRSGRLVFDETLQSNWKDQITEVIAMSQNRTASETTTFIPFQKIIRAPTMSQLSVQLLL